MLAKSTSRMRKVLFKALFESLGKDSATVDICIGHAFFQSIETKNGPVNCMPISEN